MGRLPPHDEKTMGKITKKARLMAELLGLHSAPVAVFLLGPEDDIDPFAGWARVKRHRYCQALMKARSGEVVLLEPEELACPAAAAAFGFRPLPEALRSGKTLAGFGIVDDPQTGRVMFDRMPVLEPGSVARIALSPLESAPRIPDVVVLEDEPERLMWLVLSDLNLAGGTRRRGAPAVLQATCVDCTVIPFTEQRLNFSLGCYGCREATDLKPGETVLGFPGAMLERLAGTLEFLFEKAIPRSRNKAALRRLTGGDKSEDTPPEPMRPAQRVSVLPRLEGDVVIRLTPPDVVRIIQVTIDRDRKEALRFVAGRLDRLVRKVLERPHCVPAFEMRDKISDGT